MRRWFGLRVRFGPRALRDLLALSGLVASSGCGDEVGSDATHLCVEVAIEAEAPLRLQAVYHAGEAPPEIIDDVAVAEGRACVTLRPPQGALHQITHAVPVTFFVFEGGIDPLTTAAIPIDLGVYEDRDQSGDLGPADRLRAALSQRDRARIPLWISNFEAFFSEQPAWQVATAARILPPDRRPFAFSGRVEPSAAWEARGTLLLRDWPNALQIPPTAAGTACDRAESWPRCRVLTDVPAAASLRLVDPRVDPARLTFEPSGFEPVAPLPPADAPVPTEVIARDCATIDTLLIAREAVTLPRQAPDECECTVWTRTRWVIAPADDPPPWLTCGGRPLEGEAAEALAEEAGLRR